MPAKDAFHEIVKLALQKEGWQITHDPFYLSFGGVEMYVDLGAERLIAAEKENEQIAYDGTERGIANELVDLGVPKQDIVLAFHAPYFRQYTEFAIS